MLSIFIIFIIFFLLSFKPIPSLSRRLLLHPFFPVETPSPSPSPSPSSPYPRHPFSTLLTPNQPPFFPSYHSPPPPPPSPPSSPSFPPNVSSLVFPHSSQSKSTSYILVAITIAAVISVFIFITVAVFLHCRKRRNPRFAHGKTSRSEPNNGDATTNTTGKPISSSEFLYLGTLVNSRGIDDLAAVSRNNGGGGDGGRLDSRKLDSPELRPLPPLGGQSMQASCSSSTSGSPVWSRSITLSPPVSSPGSIGVWAASPPPPLVPPPPPPPPLPQLAKRHRETSVQEISKPPAIIPPSRPFVLQHRSKVSETTMKMEETLKPKLKPLHWDKVRASSDREMVWDQLKSSSFELDEEMIETLFGMNSSTTKQTTPRSPLPNQEYAVLDPKKSQNIAISLKALNVTIEEVCEALLEGNVITLGTELLESLLKMTPTKEEEHKLKEYKDDSPIKLGPAENFLKAVLDVPFAFKRVDAMLYIAKFESEIEYLKKSFETLKDASVELRNSRMFMKLLEAVLKTGNRMNVGTNRGDAQAFKLDTLLKLVDIKAADGKTTLLHFVVQEIIRTDSTRLSSTNQTPNSTSSENANCRKLGLQIVSSLSSELGNVKKAAAMDSDVLSSDVSNLSRGIGNIKEIISEKSSQKFSESMNGFMKMAEEEIIRIQAQEKATLSLVKEITEYFHGTSTKEEAHPFRIFMVVRDFLAILDRVCKEVSTTDRRPNDNLICL